MAALAGSCVRASRAGGLPRELLEQRVPAPEVLLGTYRSELEPRTHNALCQHQPGPPDEVWTVRRLLEIRGFGVSSLLDVLAVLATHEAKPRTARQRGQAPARRLRE